MGYSTLPSRQALALSTGKNDEERVSKRWKAADMLDASDSETTVALRELTELARSGKKPIVVWVGAGASSWSDYPRWDELAQSIHAQFSRLEAGYDRRAGAALLSSKEYPKLFQLCKTANVGRFNAFLANAFEARPAGPVYQRFIGALGRLSPRAIITTNVDGLLDGSLPETNLVGRHDVQRAVELLQAGKSFVYKVHGSVSDIGSTVFTTDDYRTVGPEVGPQLARLMGSACVLFLGYGLQDDHVLKVLSENDDINALFGDGPHFAVLTARPDGIPKSVRHIRYVARPHEDHRTAVSVIEEVVAARAGTSGSTEGAQASKPSILLSAHLLFEVYPPGTWETSLKLGLSSGQELVIGPGFTNEELPLSDSRAMHDLLVGLLCFDSVYVPLNSLGRLHDLVGSERFWSLVESNTVSFVHWSKYEGVVYAEPDAVAGGMLGSYLFGETNISTSDKIAKIIRDQLKPRPGLEIEVEKRFKELESRVVLLDKAQEDQVEEIARGLLIRPSVRRLIGMSEGTPIQSIPRWAMFPVLRLAQVTKIGCTCRALGICSAKLEFGSAELAGPAFAAAMGAEWVDATAGYVVAGSFAVDLGDAAIANPGILDAVLGFRNSREGIALRLEVLERLQASAGGDVTVAINGGLRSAVPQAALQKAHDKFVRLLAPAKLGSIVPPAIWNDQRYAEKALAGWHRRSREMLREVMGRLGLGPYAQCPCGSGEQLKFCCWEALNR